TIKPNEQGILIGRVQTMAFVATIALQEVNSTNERAPAYDVLALAADRRSWVKVGALWEYSSNETGEVFLSGRIDDPSLDKPIDVAMFQQNDGSYNVAWRRPQRKRTMPAMAGGDDLPPLNATGDEQGGSAAGSTGGTTGGDGLGESTATAPKGKAKAKETADA
ncbi:DUF736 domain-containing protein, partial [uncultured Roseovarius sp.]|uniref:DUF736 domain-containing protein n=1 Tax=uncultured Roseovarius sp. TaxID=293344 RepID=UPI0026158835